MYKSTTIKDVILKLCNRYEVNYTILSISQGYRIGIGKCIIVRHTEKLTLEQMDDIMRDAKPYTVWFYEKGKEDGKVNNGRDS